MSEGRGRGHRGLHRLVSVKVDSDLEGRGVAARSGVGRGGGGAAPVVAADPGHPGDCGRGPGGGLQRHNLQVVPVGNCGALDGVDAGDAGAHAAHGGRLRRVQGGAPHPVGGLGGGGHDVGAVADCAVAPGPSDADVIILVTQMGLRSVQGGGGHVPGKAGQGT